MSIVALTDGATSSVTLETLKDVAARSNINIPVKDQAIYLLLLQSGDATIAAVDDEPDYIDPRLLPQGTVNDRKFWKSKENPLNGWSHCCEIVAANPTSSLLKGRSICLKDNISIAGLPTTLGTFAQLLNGGKGAPISQIDASIVSRLLAASVTIKGSATCENYSACPLSFSSATGPVHNPWKYGVATGGSSSGCAALLSANLAPSYSGLSNLTDLAIGGDQGGSIRIPASYTGIFGLKPTHGLVPYTGIASLYPIIDHAGPMALCVEDIALLLQVIAGYDGLDPRMTPETPLREKVKDYPSLLSSFVNRPLKDPTEKVGTPLKIGLIKESFSVPGLDPAVSDHVRQTATAAFTAAGSTVVEVSIPLHTLGPAIWTAATRPNMFEFAFQSSSNGNQPPPHLPPSLPWPPTQELYDLLSPHNPSLINLIFSGTYLSTIRSRSSSTVAKAHRKVLELRAAYDIALSTVDVLVTPCAPTVARKHPEKGNLEEMVKAAVGSTANTCPFNVTGHSAMSVPCGFLDDEEGVSLPVGMQIVGKRWEDEEVLKAAKVFGMGREDGQGLRK